MTSAVDRLYQTDLFSIIPKQLKTKQHTRQRSNFLVFIVENYIFMLGHTFLLFLYTHNAVFRPASLVVRFVKTGKILILSFSSWRTFHTLLNLIVMWKVSHDKDLVKMRKYPRTHEKTQVQAGKSGKHLRTGDRFCTWGPLCHGV